MRLFQLMSASYTLDLFLTRAEEAPRPASSPGEIFPICVEAQLNIDIAWK